MPIYPNDLDIPPFQLRRAIATTVSNYVPAMGEPVWSTDGKTLYVGDGSTQGGIPVGGENAPANVSTITNQSLFTTSSVTFANLTVTNTATIGDLALTNIASATGTNILYYDTATDKVTYGTNYGGGGGGGNPFDQDLNTTNTATFAGLTLTTQLVNLGLEATGDSTNSHQAIGYQANASGAYSTAIGHQSKANGNSGIAIGSGAKSDGTASIAIGNQAGSSPSFTVTNASNSIIINASGNQLNSSQSGFYVNPVRNTTSTEILYYDTTTKEITYGTGSGVSGNPFNQTLNTTSNVIFNSVVTQDVVSAGGYPVDSNGLALILTSNTQSAAMVVSNYTAGLIPGIQVRGWGQNRPGGATTATAAVPALTMEGARGTPASPLPTGSLDSILAISGGGYDGFDWTNGRQLNPFQILVQATENYAGNATTTTNAGARFFIRTQPQGIQLDTTSRQMHWFQTWTAGSTTAPPTANLNFGAGIDSTAPTLINSNGLNSHTGYGATNFIMVNTKNSIIGVPFEDAAVFTGSISGTTMTVTLVTSGVISVGQRIYSGTSNYGFITALGTATGGTGTYTLSTSSTVSSGTLNSGADNTTLNDTNFLVFVGGRKSGVSGRRNALKNADTVGRLLFHGQTANSATSTGSRVGQIAVRALEDFTGSARGGRMTLTTVNSGTNTESTRLQLDNLNHYYNAATHTFRNAAGSTSYLGLDTNGATFGGGSGSATIASNGSYDLVLTTNDTVESGIIKVKAGVDQGVIIQAGNPASPTTVAQFTTGSIYLYSQGLDIATFSNSQINLYNNQIITGDGVTAPRIQGRVGLQLSAANSNQGAELGLDLSGEFTFISSGSQIASFNTASTLLKTDEFTVNMQDNTQLLTAANYGVRINQGTLYVGDPGDDGTIRTSSSGDDLTIQSNNGSTGGKILLQETNGIVLYALGTQVTNISTSSAVFYVPVTFPVYTVATKPASGSVGQQICISDSAGGSNPNGMMAFWDTTNSRWSYVHDNNAV
jgi:hypothetical protein